MARKGLWKRPTGSVGGRDSLNAVRLDSLPVDIVALGAFQGPDHRLNWRNADAAGSQIDEWDLVGARAGNIGARAIGVRPSMKIEHRYRAGSGDRG
jgi:hypothetical protein